MGAGGVGQDGRGRVGGPGSPDRGGNQFASPNRGQLNSFLGLPSDEGFHGSRSAGAGRGNVGVGGDAGIGGGRAGVAWAASGRVLAWAATQGSAVDAQVWRGRRGPARRGTWVAWAALVSAWARAGRVGVGGVGGFAPVSASTRYTTAAAVRTNYDHWGSYDRDWYARYPGAWGAAGWATGAAWHTCAWGDAAAYCGYAEAPPVYYDYGNNVTYDNSNVYVNGEDVGTGEQYYDQAASLASTGAAAEAPSDGDWLPLGVFALTKSDEAKSDVSFQLAVNKQGVIRGNSTDPARNKNQVVQGSVDKQTQRVAFTVGDNTNTVVETGLYNLTKDEAPCLIHFGKDKTEQWLLVRMQKPDTAQTPTN